MTQGQPTPNDEKIIILCDDTGIPSSEYPQNDPSLDEEIRRRAHELLPQFFGDDEPER